MACGVTCPAVNRRDTCVGSSFVVTAVGRAFVAAGSGHGQLVTDGVDWLRQGTDCFMVARLVQCWWWVVRLMYMYHSLPPLSVSLVTRALLRVKVRIKRPFKYDTSKTGPWKV